MQEFEIDRLGRQVRICHEVFAPTLVLFSRRLEDELSGANFFHRPKHRLLHGKANQVPVDGPEIDWRFLPH